MNKDKIAFVVQRYGLDVNGGAEYLCRELAEHMTKVYDVSVFTSCAKSYSPWDNYYEQGLEKINGVDVYRYKVEKVGSEKRLEELFLKCEKEMKK